MSSSCFTCAAGRPPTEKKPREAQIGYPLLPKLTEVLLLLRDVPLSTFVWVGSTLGEAKKMFDLGSPSPETRVLYRLRTKPYTFNQKLQALNSKTHATLK